MSFSERDLCWWSFGSISESRPAAETRRAEAMISTLEEASIADCVLELESVAGSEELKYVALRAKNCFDAAFERFSLKVLNTCQP